MENGVVVSPIQSYLQQQGFVVLDGALATELEHHGADLNDPLWSACCLIDSSELIYRVHKDYLEAGADVLTTATYQASVQGFMERGFEVRDAEGFLRRGVELAIRARDDFWQEEANRAGRLKPLVAVSIGPFGACLYDGSEYHGRYAAGWSEVEDFHRARLQILTSAGGDLLAFETIPSLQEGEILLRLLREFPGQYAWLSFSCSDASHVSHGEAFQRCVQLATGQEQLAAIGINCTAPRHVQSLLGAAGGAACPLLVYPNSGETWVAGDHHWVGQGGEDFNPKAWFQSGARLIGGCCRTGPADIAAIRLALKSTVKSSVAMPGG
jgi:homocysteine S-methyltransferase